MFVVICLCVWCEFRYIVFMNLFLFIVFLWYNFYCCGIIKYFLIKYLLKMKCNYYINKEKINLKIKIFCYIFFFE